MHADEGNTVYVHDHDVQPDYEPSEIPTVIVEDDQESPGGALLQIILFGIAFILIILLVFELSGVSFFGFLKSSEETVNTQLLEPQIGFSTLSQSRDSLGADWVFEDGTQRPPVDSIFYEYWQANGGIRVFGYPESGLIEENGRRFQWFQRARLEWWPENLAPYTILPGRLGIEYTDGRTFPSQEFFVDRPGLWYFKETEHGVADPFLDFWRTHGGVDIFGFPISDQIIEILPEDGAPHTVQYFERGRLELHQNDPIETIKIGLLGRELYMLDSQPNIIDPVSPTAVPVQQ